MKCKQRNHSAYILRRQQGVILIVSLIMLLAMTLIGVSLSTSSVLQERLASNTRQSSLARANAESALREAEARLGGLFNGVPNVSVAIATAFNATQNDELRVAVKRTGFDLDPDAFDVIDASAWATAANLNLSEAATAADRISTGGRVQAPPRYMIEYIGLLPLNQPALNIDVSVEVRTDIALIPHAFRITAIGYGQNDRIYSVLQSVYSTDKQ